MRIFVFFLLFLCTEYAVAQGVHWVRKITIEFNENAPDYDLSPTSVNNFTKEPVKQAVAPAHPLQWNRIRADLQTPFQIAGILLHKSNFEDEIIKITLRDTVGVSHRYGAEAFTIHTSADGSAVLIMLHDPRIDPVKGISIDMYTKDDPRKNPTEAIGLLAQADFDLHTVFTTQPLTASKVFKTVNKATQYAPAVYGRKERLDDAINSVYVESKPLISPHGNRLYFVRKNAPTNYNGLKDDQDIYYSDFYNGRWTVPMNAGYPLNDRHANGVCGISPDGNTLLLLNAYKLPNGKKVENGVSISRKTYNGWTVPVEQIISGFYNLCPYQDYYINNSGDVMILALHMAETYGDQDLYVSYKTGENRWSNPVNLGAAINTEGAEFSPYLSPDNMVLYFASTGHGGYGESDIFYAVRQGNTWMQWSDPINLGAEVNSGAWDAYFSVSPQMDYGYFISSGGALSRTIYNPEDADIYRIRLSSAFEQAPVIVMRGKLFDIQSNQPVGGELWISATGKDTPEIRRVADSGDGYAISLESGKKYTILTNASGFLQASTICDFTDIRQYTELQQDIYLAPMQVGSTFNIENLNFAQSKAEILPESLPHLEKLYTLLLKEPSLQIELGGHTDNQGSSRANLTLSQERAEAIKDYLIERGIGPGRMTAVGYGSSKPIADNTEVTTRHKNRRVEVKVLNF